MYIAPFLYTFLHQKKPPGFSVDVASCLRKAEKGEFLGFRLLAGDFSNHNLFLGSVWLEDSVVGKKTSDKMAAEKELPQQISWLNFIPLAILCDLFGMVK